MTPSVSNKIFLKMAFTSMVLIVFHSQSLNMRKIHIIEENIFRMFYWNLIRTQFFLYNTDYRIAKFSIVIWTMINIYLDLKKDVKLLSLKTM